MSIPRPISVIGDVHGQIDRLLALLRGVKLIGDDHTWTGGDAILWFVGDFFDRGPDGIAVVDLVMRLQEQAAAVGGHVGALLGNHEVVLLSAYRFGTRETSGPGGTFLADWERNGGRASDLARLSARHVDWIVGLPAMARIGDRLLAHSDATFYMRYGRSVAEVNQVLAALLRSDDTPAWDRFLDDSSERLAFDDRRADGAVAAAQFLRYFGGRQLIHGHTPISYVDGRAPEQIDGPLVYADGLCVNVDGGMYLGGPGFVYQFSVDSDSAVPKEL